MVISIGVTFGQNSKNGNGYVNENDFAQTEI